jgi:uncharacterized protein (TIGR00369 family)
MTAARIPTTPELEHPGGFAAAAGLRVTHAAGDRVEGFIELDAEHHTPWGVVHGGVYTTAVESAGSIGASIAVADRGQIAVGVNNNTDFLRSMIGGRVTVTATPVQQGRTQQIWDVRIVDEAGRLVARGALRLQNIEARPPTAAPGDAAAG